MSLLAEEENTNKYLIAALQYAQTPDVNTAPQVKVINAPSTSQPLIVYLHACFPATSVKLQSIHQNNEKLLHPMIINPDSHPDEWRMCILAPNHYII